MPLRFSTLFRQHLDPFTRAWVDEVYADRRTDLATLLSFRELIEHVPDFLEELSRLLDERAGADEIADAARRLRGFAQAILVYAASLRPVVPTRGSLWPPPGRRRKP